MAYRNPFASLATAALLSAAPLLLSGQALADYVPLGDKASLSEVYPGKAYSPYAQRSFPSRVFWGDTHLHTALSMDAGLFGARLGLDEAYRFARGEEVMASSGQPAKLGRPLDWLVIADHSDGMGFISDLAAGKPSIISYEQGKRWYEGLQQGGDASAAAARFAQTLAVTSGCDTAFTVGPTGYGLFQRASSCTSGGFTRAVNRPGGQAWAQPAPAGVVVSSLSIFFDSQGRPVEAVSGLPLNATASYSVGGRAVAVEPESGYVYLP